MKKTYGTERGSHGIIIKRINDATTRMETKLMACKLIHKCRKEEVPIGVVPAVAQCANNTMILWEPYILKLFLDDCKDAKDLGTKFHYSRLMILIALIRWKEPPYSHFSDRVGCYRTTWYTSMGSTLYPKRRSGNTDTFSRYLNDIQENIANTWRVTPKVVTQYQGVANFRDTRHDMWIKPCRDIKKEWLQLFFCINIEEFEIVMRHLKDKWKILVITKEILKGKEVEIGSSKTSIGGSATTKKPTQQGKPSQKKMKQNKGTTPKKDAQIGNKDNSPV
jgi:hypothetical protein